LCARIKVHTELKKLRDEIIKRNTELEKTLNEKTIAHTRLMESEIRFRKMAENLPVAIIEIDTENKIKYFNRYSGELLGVKINENILDYIELSDKENITKHIVSLYQNENTGINLFSLISENGKSLKALFKSNLIYKEDAASGIRLTILEYEPNVNLVLLPDRKFYEKYKISEREKEIITLLIKGLSYKEISENLYRSYKTVDNHIRNIYMKTNVNSRHELIKLSQEK
jgi:PAS domain S-box-containing protein